jgi:hypothetical protein
MSTSLHDASPQATPAKSAPRAGKSNGKACLNCDIPAFCRNHYYRGKLLTEREFADEQSYFLDKLRLHKLALHGWGVVCGLQVKPHRYCPELRLVIEEGLAIDSCGREIRVLKDASIDLPQAPTKPEPPCEDDERRRASAYRHRDAEKRESREERAEREEHWNDEEREERGEERGERREEREERREEREERREEREERREEREERRERHGEYGEHEGREEHREHREKHEEHEERRERREREDDEEDEEERCEPQLPAKTLYLCIAYTECESEFSPAPFDECGCNAGSSLKPNRICEGYRLELYDSKPSFWDEAVGEECEVEDCRQLYKEAGEHCRKPGGSCCVPLAVIMDVVPGEKVTEKQIRMHGHRRQLASTETLDRVVRCILEKLPAEKLTRIDDTNWEHGQRYLCREFMSEFIGSHEHPRGFRISFDKKVNADAIDQRSFQALVVFRPEDGAQPRHMEIAPAIVHKEDGETRWCRLSIDPVYARNRLDMREFDLFLTLRCDVVTDIHGLAVDGNFIAHRFPTGDNVQGGTFESWIRVRPRHAAT